MSCLRIATICALAALVAPSCSKDTRDPAAAADAATGGDAPPAANPDGADAPVTGGGADLAPPAGPPQSCGAIRNCVVACANDAACSRKCADEAPAQARAQYQAVDMCSSSRCPPGDEACRCELECDAPSDCIEMVDECVGLEEDLFCTMDCR